MSPSPDLKTASRLRTWQGITVGTLFTGYAGYYICRSNLSVATPLLLDEYGPALTKAHIGDVASFGVLFYAIGKTFNGVAVDFFGGRRLFLLGMFASVLCTILLCFADRLGPLSVSAGASVAGAAPSYAAGLPLTALLPFFVIWALNRFVQSMGWGGLVQITARWFSAKRLATVMGVLSMSYLLGDALARLYLGSVVSAGFDWRGLFAFAAGSLAILGFGCAIFLKRRPADLGLPEPPPPPGNVYGADTGDTRLSLWRLLAPLFGSFTFWLVCLMNVGLTLIRETFNLWNPTYLVQVVKLEAGTAGIASLMFPLAGAASALLAGWLVDRLRGRYGLVVVPSLLGLITVLITIAVFPADQLPEALRTVIALGLIMAVAFFLIAPYTFCSGVLAVKLGGQRGGAASAGIIDTAGYLGATLAGSGIGRVADIYGWSAAFATLAGVAVLTLLVAGVYALRTERQPVVAKELP